MTANKSLFNISIDSHELECVVLEAKRMFLTSAKQKAEAITRKLLSDGKDYQYQEKGAAYLIIQEKLETEILEAGAQKFASEYIQQNWNKYLTAALDKAMQHKANKIAFDITKDLSKGS